MTKPRKSASAVTKSQPRGSRRKMKRFKLEEISSVDKPAQEGALAMLMKRKDSGNDALVRKLLDHYLTNSDGFASLTHSEIAKRAGVEKAEPSWPLFAALETSLHSIVADGSISDEVRLRLMKSSADDFLKAARDELPDIEVHLRKGLSEGEMTLAQLRKQMTALSQKVDAVVPKLEAIASKMAKQDFEKDDSFLDDEDDDEDEGDAADRLRSLLGKADDSMMEMDEYSAEAEKGDVDKNVDYVEDEKPTTEGEEEEAIGAGSAEPIGAVGKRTAKFDGDVIKVGDRTIRKSAIGADMFELLKSQQNEVEALRKRADDERDARQLVEFTKVADEQLGHLPGTAQQKARVLKQLSTSLDKEDRLLITRMLKAGNGAVGSAFNTVGTRYSKSASATDFNKRVSEIRARDNCSNREAMQKARRENPEAFAEYQGN